MINASPLIIMMMSSIHSNGCITSSSLPANQSADGKEWSIKRVKGSRPVPAVSQLFPSILTPVLNHPLPPNFFLLQSIWHPFPFPLVFMLTLYSPLIVPVPFVFFSIMPLNHLHLSLPVCLSLSLMGLTLGDRWQGTEDFHFLPHLSH